MMSILRMGHQRLPVLADVRGAGLERNVERRRAVAPQASRRAADSCARSSRSKIGDAGQMHARRLRHLRQVHRAEFPGADQADDERTALRRALTQLCMQIHLDLPPCSAGGSRRIINLAASSRCGVQANDCCPRTTSFPLAPATEQREIQTPAVPAAHRCVRAAAHSDRAVHDSARVRCP